MLVDIYETSTFLITTIKISFKINLHLTFYDKCIIYFLTGKVYQNDRQEKQLESSVSDGKGNHCHMEKETLFSCQMAKQMVLILSLSPHIDAMRN